MDELRALEGALRRSALAGGASVELCPWPGGRGEACRADGGGEGLGVAGARVSEHADITKAIQRNSRCFTKEEHRAA